MYGWLRALDVKRLKDLEPESARYPATAAATA